MCTESDLIPLQEIYLLCCESILATAYLDAYFGLELWDAETHIHSISGTLLYHGSYTPWIRRSTGRLCVDLSPSVVVDRPIFPAVLPAGVPYIPIPLLRPDQDATIINSLTLRQYQEIIDHCHSLSLRSSESFLVNGRMKLGSLVCHQSSPYGDPVEIASVSAYGFKDVGWKLKIRSSLCSSKPVRMRNGWTRFDYSNVISTGMKNPLNPNSSSTDLPTRV